MICSDDPSPIKRLGEQTRNTIRLRSIFKIGFLSMTLFVVMAAIETPRTHAESAGEEMEDLHAYTSCIFRKGLQSDMAHISAKLSASCIEEMREETAQEKYSAYFKDVLKGHPMEGMADVLALQDLNVAAFMVGIAKQESNWGKRSPWKAGQDCYNYWGYKTSGSRGQALGHACFGSPEEAVETVAKRIHYFVYDTGRTTASRLLVWKCGSSCAGHSPEGVARWVGTVERYSQKVLARVEEDTKDTQLLLTQK